MICLTRYSAAIINRAKLLPHHIKRSVSLSNAEKAGDTLRDTGYSMKK
jgi:hypothetical protein